MKTFYCDNCDREFKSDKFDYSSWTELDCAMCPNCGRGQCYEVDGRR